MTTSPALMNSLNSLPTPDEEGDRGGLPRPDLLVESLFLSTSLQALFPSTPTTRGPRPTLEQENTSPTQIKIPSDGFIPAYKT